MYELILASESPRRRQLLKDAGFKFTVHPTKISENLEKNMNVNEQIIDLARRKARAAFSQLERLSEGPGISVKKPALILAADTMVVHEQTPLGKPVDDEDAFSILRRLSGSTHFVKTAIAIITTPSQNEISHLESTEVQFRELTDAEIRAYIASGEPSDKAGAYAIQGKGRKFVSRCTGSWSNVVGLPIEAFENILREQKWEIERSSKA